MFRDHSRHRSSDFSPRHLCIKRSTALLVALFVGLASSGARAESSARPVPAETPGEAWQLRTQRQLEAARQQTENLTREEVVAFCQHAHAAHGSEVALLRSPWVTARGTTLQRGEVGAGEQAVSPRVRVGLGVSVTDWWRAGLIEERGAGACALYEAQTKLRTPAADIEALSLEGWQQKVTALTHAVVEAKAIIERSDAELTRGERTIVEHLGVIEDYQQLEQQLSQAELEVARLALLRMPAALNPKTISTLQGSVATVERVEGALRRNKAVSFDVEAGYDEILGTDQRLPVYGQVNVTFRPGYFWQGAADAMSETARARAAALSAVSAQGQFRELVVGVSVRRGPMANEVARLRGLIALLQQKYDALSPLTRPDARRLTERLWFQLQVARGELVRLEASLVAIEKWLASVR